MDENRRQIYGQYWEFIERLENQLIDMKAKYTKTKVLDHLKAIYFYNKMIFENSRNIAEMRADTSEGEINKKLENIQTAATHICMQISLILITFNTYKMYNIESMINSKLTQIESISIKYCGKPHILPEIKSHETVQKDTHEIENLRLSIGQEIEMQFIKLTKPSQ